MENLLLAKYFTALLFLMVQTVESSASQININLTPSFNHENHSISAAAFSNANVNSTPSINHENKTLSSAASNNATVLVSATGLPLPLLHLIFIPVYMGCTGLSMLGCMAAFAVYVIIRKVKEVQTQVRHWINWNFMSSFILRDAMLLATMTLSFMPEYIPVVTSVAWRVVIVYTVVPNIFWMFVEGLYLYLGLFFPFWTPQFRWIKTLMFAIGWVLPAVLVSVWVLVEKITEGFFNYMDIPGLVCVIAPIYLVLLVNLIMMIRVIYFLARKQNITIENLETVRRLAKCTLVLAVMLGIPFLVPVIILNTVKDYETSLIVQFLNSIWSASQGLFVAIFYVLTNDEVMTHTKRRLSGSLTPPPTNV